MASFLYDCMYYYASGMITGAVGAIVSHPFDTCKVHIQKKLKLGIMDRGFVDNIKWGYRGVWPCIVGYGIEKALVFGTYTSIMNIFNLSENNTTHTFAAGLLSGSVASLSITPAEQIKIDQQLKQKTVYSISHLYKGLTYTLLRESIGFSIYFTVYNKLMNKICKKNERVASKLTKSGFCGALSAFIAWIPIYPIDLNKTIMQSGGKKEIKLFLNELHQKNTFGKIRFLYKGYFYAMMRAVPFHSTCFVIYELMKMLK